MRKLIGVIPIMVLCVSFAVAGMTRLPNGLSIATETQEESADVTPGAGALFVNGTLEVNGATRFDGDITKAGIDVLNPQTASILAASSNTAITATSSLIVIYSQYESIISSAHPVISTASVTAYSLIRLYVSSNPFTFYDNDTVPYSGMELSSATVMTIGKGQWVDFMYHDGRWHQGSVPSFGSDVVIGGDLWVTGNDITFGNAETINNSTDGSIKFTDGTNTLATIVDDGSAGSINLGNTSRKISDDGTNYDLSFSTDTDMGIAKTKYGHIGRYITGDATNYEIDIATNVNVAQGTVSAEQLTSTDDATIADLTTTYRVLITTGRVGLTDPSGNGLTNYRISITTAIMDTHEYSLVGVADGKAGDFIIRAGTYCVQGVFSSAGAVTLSADVCSNDTGTSNGTDISLNVYDGGKFPIIDNQSGSTLTANIDIHVYE